MTTERTVRREVTQETVEPAVTEGAPATTDRPVEERVTETSTTTTQTKPTVNNVNVNSDPASGNVNINTPDGTQVNIAT